MRRVTQLGSIAVLALGVAAQVPTTGAKAMEPGKSATAVTAVVIRSWDEEQSRDLLRCCDRNGDDRLDLFEARAAVGALADARGIAAFRRLDADRDGYLDWPEFDRYYRDVVRAGNMLRLHLCRPQRETSAAAAAGSTTPRSAQRRVLELFDSDHDGGLSRTEREKLLRELGMPPMFAATLDALDRNRNGLLEEQELAPALAQFNLGDLFARGGAQQPASALAPPWTQIDEDGDGSISGPELAAALRRIDPELARWTDRILAHTDRNGNGRIGADELPSAGTPTAQAMAGPRSVR